MKALHGSNQIVVEATPAQVWAVLQDSSLLTQWAPMVKHTTGQIETVGSSRACQVEWKGRKDEVVERCVEAVPHQRISWVMEKTDMKKMFSDIRFGFRLEPHGPDATRLTMEGTYSPRHVVAWAMYSFLLRRMLHQLRESLLANLKRFIEERRAASAGSAKTARAQSAL